MQRGTGLSLCFAICVFWACGAQGWRVGVGTLDCWIGHPFLDPQYMTRTLVIRMPKEGHGYDNPPSLYTGPVGLLQW